MSPLWARRKKKARQPVQNYIQDTLNSTKLDKMHYSMSVAALATLLLSGASAMTYPRGANPAGSKASRPGRSTCARPKTAEALGRPADSAWCVLLRRRSGHELDVDSAAGLDRVQRIPIPPCKSLQIRALFPPSFSLSFLLLFFGEKPDLLSAGTCWAPASLRAGSKMSNTPPSSDQ
jgi:hypothetical protein